MSMEKRLVLEREEGKDKDCERERERTGTKRTSLAYVLTATAVFSISSFTLSPSCAAKPIYCCVFYLLTVSIPRYPVVYAQTPHLTSHRKCQEPMQMLNEFLFSLLLGTCLYNFSKYVPSCIFAMSSHEAGKKGVFYILSCSKVLRMMK